MSRIYYIGSYGDSVSYSENRTLIPAGVSKMEYVTKAIKDSGQDVFILSPTRAQYDSKVGLKLYHSRTFSNKYGIECKNPASIGFRFKPLKWIMRLYSKLWLAFCLLSKVRKGDTVVVYNSPLYFGLIYYLKKIVNFKLIMEVEEVYSIVFSMSESWKRKELRLINSADVYIFPNDLMAKNLNICHKPFVVVYGNYQINEVNTSSIFNDNRIHVVYAGIIDKLKYGAFNAISAAKYLEEKYVIHILGFGTDKDIKTLNREIDDLNQISKCKIEFEGKKLGQKYVDFMSSCHVGLNTMRNEGVFLDFSFPSKVLSYMSIGLAVVGPRIKCLTESSIDKNMIYYDVESGENIANAISRASAFLVNENRSKIKALNIDFINSLRELFENNTKCD